jgi:hypothetical protein
MDRRNYAVEASTNLTTWIEIGTAVATNGLVTFSDQAGATLPRRFYRARDLSAFISFAGIVLDSKTGRPITNASISSSIDGQTASTDSGGHFILQTRTNGKVIGLYSLTAHAAGFVLAQIPGFYSGGNQLSSSFRWVCTAGGAGNEISRATAVDNDGNCFIAGISGADISFGNITLAGTGSADGFIAKYDPQGAALWARQIGGDKSDNASGVATDNSGNCYLTGFFQGSVYFGGALAVALPNTSSTYVAKFDRNGNLIWLQTSVSTTGTGGQGRSICVDPLGNSYTVGYYGDGVMRFGSVTMTNGQGGGHMFIVKYSSQGDLKWASQFRGSVGGQPVPIGIACNNSGETYVFGQLTGTALFGGTTLTTPAGVFDNFVAKFDSTGNAVWAEDCGTRPGSLGGGIAVDGSGNCYITGVFKRMAQFGTKALTNSDPFGTIFVARLDPHGTCQWAQQAGGPYFDYSNAIAVDALGNCCITGQFNGPADFSGATLDGSGVFVAKYDQSGGLIWLKTAQGPSTSGSGIAIAKSGSIYVTGSVQGTAVFGSTTVINTGTVGQNTDVFVCELNDP